MKRLVVILLVVSVSILSFGILRADNSPLTCTTNANDHSGLPQCFTPADNECYAGGTMAGKCTSDWDWNAGWYMARLNRGVITYAQIPAEYASLLPEPYRSMLNGSPTCSITFNTSNGDLALNANWVTALAGQASVVFTGSSANGGGSTPALPIAASDTSGVWALNVGNRGGALLTVSMNVRDGSGASLLTVNCSITNL